MYKLVIMGSLIRFDFGANYLEGKFGINIFNFIY